MDKNNQRLKIIDLNAYKQKLKKVFVCNPVDRIFKLHQNKNYHRYEIIHIHRR